MTRVEIRLRLGIFAAALVGSLLYTFEASGFNDLAMYAPLSAGSVASFLLVIACVREMRRLRALRRSDQAHGAFERSEEYASDPNEPMTAAVLLESVRYFVVICAFVFAVWALGLWIAAPLFVAVALRVWARCSVTVTVAIVLGLLVFMYIFGEVIGFVWPTGSWTGL